MVLKEKGQKTDISRPFVIDCCITG